MIDLPPANYEQTIAAIVRCAIPRTNVRIAYEQELQSDEITITDIGHVDDAKLRCLKAAVHPFYILTIQNQQQQASFYDFSRREDRPREKAAATEWLRKKGLFDQLPSYDDKHRLTMFVAALERVCGLGQERVLQTLGDKTFTIRPDFTLGSNFERLGQVIECVMKLYAASNAPDAGINFGFVGNEAVPEKK